MDIEALWREADAAAGHFIGRRTIESRRRYPTDEDVFHLRNPFVSDIAKLLSSKAFRQLDYKTQVFPLCEIPLVRTRGHHVREVVAIAIVIAEMLGLNVALTEAIANGHDIGHVPLGHAGERWMAAAMGRSEFCHEVLGVVVAQKIERAGKGLNLTWHTLDGMLRHSGAQANDKMSPEAKVVRWADKMAYLFADYNDINLRMKFPISQEVVSLANFFGSTQRERTTTAQAGLIIESAQLGTVSFERSELGKKFQEFRSLMYGLYKKVTDNNVISIMEPSLELLTRLKIADPFLLLAMMNDSDVAFLSEWKGDGMEAFMRTSGKEILPYLADIGTVDLCDPDLNW